MREDWEQAARAGDTSVLGHLLDEGADVDALVAAGADRSLRGSGAPGFDDRTALDLARARGSEQMVSLLDG